MSNCSTIVSVLTSNGSDQKQRYISALQPENIRLNDFEITDWILFAHNFSEYVNYYETSNPETPASDWKSFFDFFELNDKNPTVDDQLKLDRIKKDLVDLIEESKIESEITPHLTLFIAFLMLLENSKKRYNDLTQRHLDFYYNQILKIDKLPATPDKVYMIFELAKNATQEKIEAKTGFDGGKDTKGKTRNYYSNDELIANKTTVTSLKNVYNDVTGKKIVASPIANSYDGLGKAFPDENTQWWPFGYTSDSSFPTELPNATLGFAIASPILSLAEGKRSIEMSFTFDKNITILTPTIIKECLSIQLTSAKKWVEVAEIKTSIALLGGSYTTSVSGKIMKIAFQLDENVDAITGYNSKIYGEEFSTELPVAKFYLDTSTSNGYDAYKSLAENKLVSITINIDVQNVQSVVLENDNGTLNAAKPFFPFSTQPVVGSNFYIKYEEAFTKKWNSINVDMLWKNTPNKFEDHYKGYKKSNYKAINISAFIATDAKKNPTGDEADIVANKDYFKHKISVLSNNLWEVSSSDVHLFSSSNPFKTNFSLNNTNKNFNTEKNGQLKLTLNTSFLHNLYSKTYALALSSDDTSVVIPNEPYTPLAESLVLSYSASETTNFVASGLKSVEEIYLENEAKLFHIHPFGHSEEHSFLKLNLEYVDDTNSYLIPTYCKGGELFIGLENVQELQQITLLFQVLEGSENPLTPSFSGKQKIEWSVLGNNEWRILEYSDILLNETDNLLQSGILKFNLPKEATQTNTRLPKNYIWLKAKMHKKYDVVCKITGIHAQAVLATFENDSNDVSHLKTGIEAQTISKLVQRLSNVKSVTQPYNSFGYKGEESNQDYYRRISERLRHKNRAVTMWDYEHIILQEFPELYKVKCLNHTSENSYQSPGNVTLVVIPDTVNKNVFDIYQPRVSTATLNKVKEHIDQLNSMHVTTFVINPYYEEVTIDLKVKFKSGYDENFYSQELNTDITKFLSPWAFDKSIPITFGVSIHSSSLINYVEKLGYVDYLQDVKLLKNGSLTDKEAVPSDPKSILVSAKSHFISTDIKECSVKSIESKEECQL